MNNDNTSENGLNKSAEASVFTKQQDRRRTLSLSEQIAEHVGKSILQETYLPGEAVTEQRISEEFAVSRGPVREALRILEREGLVEIIPRRGARVTRLTVREVSDIFDIRSVLLGHAARLAAQRRDEECLRVLKEGCDTLTQNVEGADELDVHSDVSAQMNFILVERSGNDKLSEIVNHLARQIARYTRIGLSTSERRRDSVTSWRELIQLIENGLDDEADRLERQRVRKVQTLAIKLLQENAR